MSADGPSKKELEYYFKNSRKYFDELAKHFYETDREYYDKFIAPFYSPFGSMTPGSAPKNRAALSLVIAGLLALLAAGFAFFLIFQSTEKTTVEPKKKIESSKENTGSRPDEKVKPSDTQTQSSELSDYEKGLRFYNQKDYDTAERYFNRVTRGDDNYDEAQNKLEEIRKLREENSSGKEKERSRRVQPIERIR